MSVLDFKEFTSQLRYELEAWVEFEWNEQIRILVYFTIFFSINTVNIQINQLEWFLNAIVNHMHDIDYHTHPTKADSWLTKKSL